jgi:cytochrome c-type biogenesis protein CcmH/NrfG
LYFVNLASADFPEKTAKITISVPNLPQLHPTSLTLQPVSTNPTAWAALEVAMEAFLSDNHLPTPPTQTEDWLALASFFVQKGLVVNALGAYRQALNTASEAEQVGVRAVYEVFVKQYAKPY